MPFVPLLSPKNLLKNVFRSNFLVFCMFLRLPFTDNALFRLLNNSISYFLGEKIFKKTIFYTPKKLVFSIFR